MERSTQKQHRDTRSVTLVSETSLARTNGVTNTVKKALDHFSLVGYEAQVHTPKPGLSSDAYKGYPVITGRTRTVRGYDAGVESAKRLRQAMKEFKPDVVHLASPFLLGWAGLRAARRLQIPTVAVYQTDMPEYAYGATNEWLEKKLNVKPKWIKELGSTNSESIATAIVRWIHSTATRTLSPSTAADERLISFGVDSARIHRWGRGVDTELFSPTHRDAPESQRLHAEWSAAGEKVVVGYFGRLDPEKEVERLAVLRDPLLQLVVVGDGIARPMLEETLPAGTIFKGEKHGSELAHAVAAFDIMVHTGTNETFGQTIQEAMASGLPVIAPAKGGPLDIISKPGENGLLYDPIDPTELRERVDFLVHSQAARRYIGERACTAMQAKSWASVNTQLLEHYEAAIEKH